MDLTVLKHDQRDSSTNITTLDGMGQVYHVVTGSDNSLLDGFSITGGNAAGDSKDEESGGGLYLYQGFMEIIDCLFSDNKATWGGGISSTQSTIEIKNCSFSNNKANWGGGGVHEYEHGRRHGLQL